MANDKVYLFAIFDSNKDRRRFMDVIEWWLETEVTDSYPSGNAWTFNSILGKWESDTIVGPTHELENPYGETYNNKPYLECFAEIDSSEYDGEGAGRPLLIIWYLLGEFLNDASTAGVSGKYIFSDDLTSGIWDTSATSGDPAGIGQGYV